MYLTDLIDEIQDDINEVKFTIDGNISNSTNYNSLLLKKQYTIEYDGITSAYGVDVDCSIYEEDNEQILYIYPSNNKIEFDDNLFQLEKEHVEIDKAEAESEMKKWFSENYDDPTNFLPYETKEGGFQYLYGGPYELDEIMYEEFGEKYPDDYIQKVIENLEHQYGDVSWGKKPTENDVYIEDGYVEKGYVESYKPYDFQEREQKLDDILLEKNKKSLDNTPKNITVLPQVSLTEKINTNNIVNAQIAVTFEGWSGESIIKLTNGEVWKQSEYYYEYNYSYMPNVTIINSPIGYKMKVDGVNKEVGVEQLKNIIESKIHGSFNGWTGDTMVELINGEKWKQLTYAYSYSYSYNPDVIIYRSDYGFKMKVDGNDKTVDVERVI